MRLDFRSTQIKAYTCYNGVYREVISIGRYGLVHMMLPTEQYEKLRRLKDMLGARTWPEFADKVYEILMSKTLEEACSKICETKLKKPPILEAVQS